MLRPDHARAGVLFLFLLFLFLRLYGLGAHDFWYDEAYSIKVAHFAPGFAEEPRLYYQLLHFWFAFFPVSELSARFPSFLFSALSIVLLYVLGKELFNRTIGTVASLLMGLSPFHLWYAQEARNYSMVLFISVLSTLLLWLALKKGTLRLWLLFSFFSAAGFYVNYFYVTIFFAHGLYWLACGRKKNDFRGVASFLLILIAYLFSGKHFYYKLKYIQDGFWLTKPPVNYLRFSLENFFLGYNGTTFLYRAADVCIALLAVSSLVLFLRKKEYRKTLLFCLCLFFLPLVGTFIFSRLFFSIYIDRGLIILSPYFYLILSLGLFSLRRRIRFIFLACLLALIISAGGRYYTDTLTDLYVHHEGLYIKKPMKPIADFLDKNVKEGDTVVFTHPDTALVIPLYTKTRMKFYYIFDPLLPHQTDSHRPLSENGYYLPIQKIDTLASAKMWVVSSSWPRNGTIDSNSKSVLAQMEKRFRKDSADQFDGVLLSGFSR